MKSHTLWKSHSGHPLSLRPRRRFRGHSIHEALSKAEISLGSDIFVVATYYSQPRNWLRLKNGDHEPAYYEVEVVQTEEQGPPVGTAESLVRSDLTEVHHAVSRIEQTGEDPLRLWDVPETLIAPYQYLLRAGVRDEYAERIVRHAVACHHARDLTDESSAWQAALEATADGFSIASRAEFVPDQKRVILVVGPTGVGKTTALAKMAAHLQLSMESRIGLISCDMFRIAAVEQLDTYARIMNVPFSASDHAQGVADAVGEMEADWILIDTPGLSPLDQPRLQQLGELVEVLSPDEIHLVLPLESAGGWSRLTFENFQQLNPDRIIVTKTDEVEQHGGLINLAAELRLPFSYISTGQRIPDDFAAANPDRMAHMILG
ncbi:MAG: Flagellar biosynthesis protein FlhF [Planctomycetota bacterium]